MNPLIRFLVDLFGLTEEQAAKLKDYQTTEVFVGELFLSDDPTIIRVGLRDLDRMCLNIPPRVMRVLIPALTEVYRTMDAAKAELTRTTLERAVGDAAGEGMGTARPSRQEPNAPPSPPNNPTDTGTIDIDDDDDG